MIKVTVKKVIFRSLLKGKKKFKKRDQRNTVSGHRDYEYVNVFCAFLPIRTQLQKTAVQKASNHSDVETFGDSSRLVLQHFIQ